LPGSGRASCACPGDGNALFIELSCAGPGDGYALFIELSALAQVRAMHYLLFYLSRASPGDSYASALARVTAMHQ